MYAELFRTLGWIQSTTSRLTYAFSLLGDHVAVAHNPAPLLRECLIGIAYPNEVLGVQSEQTVRVIGGILLVMDTLGSISRDEMMAGPMSISDDTNLSEFDRMVLQLKRCRTEPGELDKWINFIAAERKISRNPTMENYTRFPMAAFPWSGWGIKKGRGVINITDEGRAMAAKLRAAPDMRLLNFNGLPDDAKPAFIRWTFYTMLERAGFNIEQVRPQVDAAVQLLNSYGLPSSRNVFFSPFQQLSRETIAKWAPELIPKAVSNADQEAERIVESVSDGGAVAKNRSALIFELSEHISGAADQASELRKEIGHALGEASSVEDAINVLFAAYSTANKDVFYPLVANLFCILGFDCRVSRSGQNYERADAIILDTHRSIPIEIKSPGEETEISVKGVRQALENKVVLLSRKSYPTDRETTSLVVGFNPPNDRSEVHELVEDIRKAFDVRVGVIDFRSLLSLAVYAIYSGKQISFRDFHLLQGAIRVERLAPTR
ncbi:hypothetical protein N5C12_06560 [Comamonas aquatica]|uniref:hypothetical protein n=1 Tax=Comamonas aquatica TaxID=225991 RepID=UPI002447D4F5|nr:hypothetical protein [Comamonas aquatica]MDH0899011.1 hypothetical protein [Comamonas aquatica]